MAAMPRGCHWVDLNRPCRTGSCMASVGQRALRSSAKAVIWLRGCALGEGALHQWFSEPVIPLPC